VKNEPKRLIREQNPVSSRVAFVGDDGYFVWLAFLPRSRPNFPLPANMELPDRLRAIKSRLSERTMLYRRPSSPLDWARSQVREENPPAELIEVKAQLAESIKALSLPEDPAVKLIWSHSGESVVAVLNGEPWALIDGNTGQAFSKGVLGTHFGKPWDEDLFQKTFNT